MIGIISSILTSLGPLIVWLAEKFIANQQKREEFIKSYYSFLDKVDKSVQSKVANSIALREARRRKQQELLEKKKQQKENQNEQGNQ